MNVRNFRFVMQLEGGKQVALVEVLLQYRGRLRILGVPIVTEPGHQIGGRVIGQYGDLIGSHDILKFNVRWRILAAVEFDGKAIPVIGVATKIITESVGRHRRP